MEPITVTLYAHLASALINGDTSGLEQGDQDPDLLYALEYLAGLDVVDVGEPYFGQPETTGLRGEVADYVCFERKG